MTNLKTIKKIMGRVFMTLIREVKRVSDHKCQLKNFIIDKKRPTG